MENAAAAETGISEDLCRYALGVEAAALPGPVLERTKLLFIDFLAVALGGSQVGDSNATFLTAIGDLARGAQGTCTVIGEAALYTPHHAAFLNAALAHTMDYDDTHRDAVTHPGAPIFSTLLALAEDSDATGADFLAAAVAGYDVLNKIGKAHGTKVHARGFHPTATTGIFGATAASARLLRLSLEQTVNAFGMNVSQAAGAHQFHANGSWDKRVHTGFAAHNAITSIVFARRGHRGSQDPIEGQWGYFALYADGHPSARPALDGLGSEFEVMNTALKPYPACRCSHSVIDAMIDIAHVERVAQDEIEAVDVTLTPYSMKIVAEPASKKQHPRSIIDAQFSVYFAVAAAARGRYEWRSYELLTEPSTAGLMDRVSVRADASLPQYGCTVSVHTKNGRTIERANSYPKGEPELPMTEAECAEKFRQSAEPMIGSARAQRLLDIVMRLETLPNFHGLTRLLRQAD